MKGLELPISMIVIIAVAVLVLVVVAAFFAGYFGTGTGAISLESAFSRGCAALRAGYQCLPENTGKVIIADYAKTVNDPNKGIYSLQKICEEKGLAVGDTNACARACGCLIT